MVDSVMIDTGYDGKVFKVALSDVPERKTDLVAGRYEPPAPKGPATVAVKITDMLGEEVLAAAFTASQGSSDELWNPCSVYRFLSRTRGP